ncbi:MAG: hypothetical protein ACR2JO_14015 [Mycobacteriales bacterium]
MTAARLAEDAGDFDRAISLLKDVPRPLDDGWVAALKEVRSLPGCS